MEMKPAKCECDQISKPSPGMADWYDAEKELPFVDHQPGECRCTNDLAQYERGGKVVWLCSCCCLFGDRRIAIAREEIEG